MDRVAQGLDASVAAGLAVALGLAVGLGLGLAVGLGLGLGGCTSVDAVMLDSVEYESFTPATSR